MVLGEYMKLWKIIPQHDCLYDCVNSVIVAAETFENALALARRNAGDEGRAAYDNAIVKDLSEVDYEGIICCDYQEI